MTLSSAASAGVRPRVSGRRQQHRRRVSQLPPGVPLLVGNFPLDLGAQVQVADEGERVQGQRQQEQSQEDEAGAPTRPAFLAAHHAPIVREALRGGTAVACHCWTERVSRSCVPYLSIIKLVCRARAQAVHVRGDS